MPLLDTLNKQKTETETPEQVIYNQQKSTMLEQEYGVILPCPASVKAIRENLITTFDTDIGENNNIPAILVAIHLNTLV